MKILKNSPENQWLHLHVTKIMAILLCNITGVHRYLCCLQAFHRPTFPHSLGYSNTCCSGTLLTAPEISLCDIFQNKLTTILHFLKNIRVDRDHSAVQPQNSFCCRSCRKTRHLWTEPCMYYICVSHRKQFVALL